MSASPPPNATASSSIEASLRSNLQLQAELVRRVRRIQLLKARNRRAASGVASSLRHLWMDGDGGVSSGAASAAASAAGTAAEHLSPGTYGALVNELKRRRREAAATADGGPSGKGPAAAAATGSGNELRAWKRNDRRKWSRRYFVDPDGSAPRPNADVDRRSEWESRREPAPACPCGSSPWSKGEVGVVERAREVVGGENPEAAAAAAASASSVSVAKDKVDFDRVAAALARDSAACAAPSRAKKAAAATSSSADGGGGGALSGRTRTASDCRIKFLTLASPSVAAGGPKLGTDESRTIRALASEHGGHPPWDVVAAAATEAADGSGGKRFTPWQCFLHAQRGDAAAGATGRPWSEAEDALLLKSIAALGPQFVLGRDSMADLTSRLFPDRSVKQVMVRANTSLVNPNYRSDTWSDDEERRLALCMRAYHGSPSPILKAYAHFPDRASKSVAEKWTRSLNPDLSFRKFDRKEDRRLLDAVREAGGPGNWANMARERFPHRSARTVKYRWDELKRAASGGVCNGGGGGAPNALGGSRRN